MAIKEKITLDYSVNTTPNILYYRLHNPSGLEEWFADKVSLRNNIYTFEWSQSEQQAELLEKKENEFVKFRWLDSEDNSYVELKIVKQEVTGDTALYITDFAEPDEKDEIMDMWDEQISQLKHNLGV